MLKSEICLPLTLCCALMLAGCYEDYAQVTLRSDGSGIVKTRAVVSEQMVVATSEGDAGGRGPSIEKDEIIEEIGDAMEITSINLKELSDGGREIEVEGEFKDPAQFFLSEFCRENLRLRLVQPEEGKAAIQWTAGEMFGQGPDIAQLYGAAKGLYVKRSVHLPGAITETNGVRAAEGNTVSWTLDLRNRQALAKTKAFIEGPDEGLGVAVFDASALTFSLPLKAKVSTQQTGELKGAEDEATAADYSAKVAYISAEKKRATGAEGKSEYERLEIGVEVTWTEEKKPLACEIPVLTHIADDTGRQLLSENASSSFQSRVRTSQKSKTLKVRAKTPSEAAKVLHSIEGYITVVADTIVEKVELEGIRDLVGKESTGNEVLDKIDFRIESIKGNQIKIAADGGNDKIKRIEPVKDDGQQVSKTGGMGGGDWYTYDFAEDVSKVNKLRLEVVTGERKVKVPFSLEQIQLP